MRLTLCIGVQYDAIVHNIVGEAMADKELIAQKYNHMVLNGKLSAAVCFEAARNGGGVLLPQDACTKTGRLVIEVLQLQHPNTRTPNLGDTDCITFKHHNEMPMALPTDCTFKDLEAL
jgi:hypothetical protein